MKVYNCNKNNYYTETNTYIALIMYQKPCEEFHPYYIGAVISAFTIETSRTQEVLVSFIISLRFLIGGTRK